MTDEMIFAYEESNEDKVIPPISAKKSFSKIAEKMDISDHLTEKPYNHIYIQDAVELGWYIYSPGKIRNISKSECDYLNEKTDKFITVDTYLQVKIPKGKYLCVVDPFFTDREVVIPQMIAHKPTLRDLTIPISNKEIDHKIPLAQAFLMSKSETELEEDIGCLERDEKEDVLNGTINDVYNDPYKQVIHSEKGVQNVIKKKTTDVE